MKIFRPKPPFELLDFRVDDFVFADDIGVFFAISVLIKFRSDLKQT